MTGAESILDKPLTKVLGTRSGNLFSKKLRLETLGDLLRHYPRRYIQPGELTDLSGLIEGEEVTVQAKVTAISTRSMRQKRGSITEVTISDDVSSGTVTFFNQAWLADKLPVGTLAVFTGKVSRYRNKLQLASPVWFDLSDLIDSEERPADDRLAAADVTRPIPVYRATEKLGTMTIFAAVRTLLKTVDLDAIPDPLPAGIVERRDLPSVKEAFLAVHRPMSIGHAYSGLARFRFEEAFALQTALAQRRVVSLGQTTTARPGAQAEPGLLQIFDQRLPFQLTGSQKEVGAQIADDLSQPHPMHRLLHGEVGSGKTLVALRAMLQVIDSGGQAALLAPTEVLAAQHYRSISKFLGELGQGTILIGNDEGMPVTRVGLLTGSMTNGAKQRVLLDLIAGDIGILIGTHALIQDSVTFNDLGLVVVDEQHRFGVKQRDALRGKTLGGEAPHTLVMTATPIPRTVAMTVFGDLDVSTLTDLPGGEKDIATHLVSVTEHPGWVARIWQRVREEIDAGRQAYVVAPRITGNDDAATPEIGDGPDVFDQPELAEAPDSSEQPPLNAVTDVVQELRDLEVFDGVRIEVLHGQLTPEDKERTMDRFAAGDVGILVSTTVIEVGVDVENAAVMVILDADRFGIAQLHQLRGRVGRGRFPGLCFLVTAMQSGHPSYERLQAVADTLDGFELSKIDVGARREGDVLGSAQSGGKSSLKLLRVLHDEKVISEARDDATGIVEADPLLSAYPDLRALMGALLNEENEEYLERG
ncbi:ATP-dependent DNA helicase RecG [Saxibacter everestensis]|uniref:ATP-dependent DNA helicase RecG n=1 Tax=Saxibacter everestensis TaxID=2909229 RepID=A0ABY8QVJ9_9MICO|nr:ATP-dependent DNA helicase RecG [Brevibacteriaceae bacterium ZFBP1038]